MNRAHSLAGLRVLLGTALITAAAGLTGVRVSDASPNAYPTTFSARTIVDGDVNQPFYLDNGVVRITPWHHDGTPPPRVTAEERATLEATSQVAGYQFEGIGVGLVTIAKGLGNAPTVTRQPAIVMLVKFTQVLYCPVLPTTTEGTVPPSSGWAVVTMGIAGGGPSYVYRARWLECGTTSAASLVAATKSVSLPWHRASGGGDEAVATVPSCTLEVAPNSSTSGGVTTFTVVARVLIASDGYHCASSGERRVGPVAISARHGRTGLVRTLENVPRS